MRNQRAHKIILNGWKVQFIKISNRPDCRRSEMISAVFCAARDNIACSYLRIREPDFQKPNHPTLNGRQIQDIFPTVVDVIPREPRRYNGWHRSPAHKITCGASPSNMPSAQAIVGSTASSSSTSRLYLRLRARRRLASRVTAEFDRADREVWMTDGRTLSSSKSRIFCLNVTLEDGSG